MCGFDVLCADDPARPGVVSAEFREERRALTVPFLRRKAQQMEPMALLKSTRRTRFH